MLIGLGKEKGVTYETVRKVLAKALKELSYHGQDSAEILMETLVKENTSNREQLTQAAAEGAILASYKCRQFKHSDKQKKETSVKTLIFLFEEKHKKQAEKGLKTGTVLGECTNTTKRLASFPGNFMTPSLLADEAVKLTGNTKIKVSVWNKARIKKE